MKGLILKDLFALQQQSRLLAGLVIFYIFYALIIQDIKMLNLIILITLMLPMITMAYDEKSKWDKYALSTPVSRDAIVLSKYLFAVILLLAGTIIVAAVSAFAVFISKGITDMSITEALMMPLGVGAIGLMFLSLMLPILFKFGVEKARIITMVIVFIPVFLGTVSDRLGISFPGEPNLTLLLYLLPVIVILLMLISIKLSVAVYNKKEF